MKLESGGTGVFRGVRQCVMKPRGGQDDARPHRPDGRIVRSPYPPLLLVTQRAEATRYFLYEFVDEDGDSSACCIEFASDSFETPDTVFVEVTLSELHERGHKTAAEQLSLASPENVATAFGPSPGREAFSWIVFGWDGPALHCWRGSMTSTTIREHVKVRGQYKKYWRGRLRSTGTPVSAVDINGPEVDVWWHTKHNPYATNPPRFYTWNQHGWHWWNRVEPPAQTDVWATELPR